MSSWMTIYECEKCGLISSHSQLGHETDEYDDDGCPVECPIEYLRPVYVLREDVVQPLYEAALQVGLQFGDSPPIRPPYLQAALDAFPARKGWKR